MIFTMLTTKTKPVTHFHTLTTTTQRVIFTNFTVNPVVLSYANSNHCTRHFYQFDIYL